MTDYRDVRTSKYDPGREQRIATFKAIQMIWLLLGILEALLAMRFVFKLIAVNAANPFVALIYNVTNLFVAPFASMLNSPATGGMVLEISSIIAMIVYLLVFWGINKLVTVLFYRPRAAVSVRQTSVSEHTPPQAPLGVSQMRTTTTERTNTQTPGSF